MIDPIPTADRTATIDVVLHHRTDERYADDNADQILGRTVAVAINGVPHTGRVVDAHVDELGLHATIEIPSVTTPD